MPYLNMNPLFSIIAPTLGRLELWKFALNSALRQHFGDFEIIAVNSKPNAESRTLIRDLNDSRLKYFEREPQEPPINWDFGYRKTSGQYILWLDDDNYLLPHALSKLAQIIKSCSPDIATGDHFHWRDSLHPNENYRNQLIIRLPLFTNEVGPVDPRNFIRNQFGMPPQGFYSRARFHFSETAFARPLIEKALSKIQAIDFRTTSPRMVHFGFLAMANSIWYVSSPIAIIIQMGGSMAYGWAKKESLSNSFNVNFEHSPVSANIYINYVAESLLLAKEVFRQELAPYEMNWNIFFKTYARELMLSKQTWGEMASSWKEFYNSAKRYLNFTRRTIFLKTLKCVLSAAGIKISKALHIYSYILILKRKTEDSPPNRRIIKLDKYNVHNIQECAQLLPQIIKDEWKNGPDGNLNW